MANNGKNEQVMKMCPLWKKTCAEVCPSCNLLTPIHVMHVGPLGVPTQQLSSICAFVAACMIGSNRPQPAPTRIPMPPHIVKG